MPRIKPRRGRFQVSAALGAAISGYGQGKAQAEQSQRQDRQQALQEKRYADRYAETERRASRAQAERDVQRKILMDHSTKASKGVQGGFDEWQTSRKGKMKPEEFQYFKSKMDSFGATAQQMIADGYNEKQVRSFANEYREGMEQEMFGLEYKKIEERLYGLEESAEKLGIPPELIKQVREAMQDENEIASPNALNQTLDGIKTKFEGQYAERRRVLRNEALGDTLLASGNPAYDSATSENRDLADKFNVANASLPGDELRDGILAILAGGRPSSPYDVRPDDRGFFEKLFSTGEQPGGLGGPPQRSNPSSGVNSGPSREERIRAAAAAARQ